MTIEDFFGDKDFAVIEVPLFSDLVAAGYLRPVRALYVSSRIFRYMKKVLESGGDIGILRKLELTVASSTDNPFFTPKTHSHFAPMSKCSNLPPLPSPPPFTGCDGKVISDDLIEAQLQAAIQEERYEDAAQCRDELARREKAKEELKQRRGNT